MSSTNGVTSGPNDVSGGNESKGVVLKSRNKDLFKNLESCQRKLESAFVKGWREEIRRNGFAKCIIASCNFISLDISSIQSHYRACDGVQLYDKNLCDNCSHYLPTSGELSQHKSTCGGMSKSKQTHLTSNKGKKAYLKKEPVESSNNWDSQLRKSGEAFCGYGDCNFIGMKLTDLEDHYKACKGVSEFGALCCMNCKSRFQTREDLGKHKANCKGVKREGNMHFSTIKRMKNLDEDHIVQPVPEFPQGEYRRRRPYTKEHSNSWISALKKCQYVKCMYQNCYFIAMSLEDMISHYGYCNGDGNFARFFCPHCGGRVTSEAVLLKHLERSHSSGGLSAKKESAVVDVPKENSSHSKETPAAEKSDEENKMEASGDLIKSKKNIQGKKKDRKRDRDDHGNEEKAKRSFISSDSPMEEMNKKSDDVLGEKGGLGGEERLVDLEDEKELESSQRNSDNLESAGRTRDEEELVKDEKMEDFLQPKKRGRKPKNALPSPKSSHPCENDPVKCGKCEFEGTRKNFLAHNLKKHVGLGWIEGETPVDMEDEKEVIRLVKMAFKLTKKGTCENCQDVKKSFMGFVTHIQNCGKSAEEKHALKVQCPHCSGKYLKYSLPVHIKLSHWANEEGAEETSPVSGKRRSALKAVSKFQESFTENEEPDEATEANYFFYEKGAEKLPKLCTKLNNLWYKLKREKKKIPCRHGNCTTVSDDVREAREHHYTCPLLPEKVFVCGSCDFHSVDETTIQSHVTVHRRVAKQRKRSIEEDGKKKEGEDEEEEQEDEEEDEESESAEGDSPKKRKKRRLSGEPQTLEVDAETRHRQNFCKRENLENARGFQFYNNCLSMTLEEEISDAEVSESWPQLHTSLSDWCHVPPEVAPLHFPELTESISIGFGKPKWRKMKVFEGDINEGVPTMFLGGSVRSLSWCKVSFERMAEKIGKQYLAVSTASDFDHFKDIHERFPLSKSGLIQIWDCGPLANAPAKEAPKLSLGIVHEGGEIWDLSWFPEDLVTEGNWERLPRLGLLATASQDGAVRIWSICDPSHLVNSKGSIPIYEIEPVVKLITDEHFEESCFRLAVGQGGVVAGGYDNGVLALWNLKNISSPFCRTVGKCRIIKAHCVIQAHKTSITAMAFCPSNGRYLSTGGLDRLIKLWDLEAPSVAVEQSTREVCLDMVWTRNWPLLIYSFDDVLPNSSKGFVKFVRDALWEKHHSCFSMESTCLSLCFSDWLNVLCASSNTGEIKMRLMKNFISDQKKSQNTLSYLTLQKLCEDGEEEKARGTYKEVVSKFGLVIKDNLGVDKMKGKKQEPDPEEVPLRAVNKVAFNPNLKSFTHLATGYNCGLVRILCLKELQQNRTLKSFLEKTEK